MLLYHGSTNIIRKPQYGFGRTDNDYGQGFYCAEDIELAREWACLDERGGFVNIYHFDTNGLHRMEIAERDVLAWLALLLNNRNLRYASPVEKRDAEYLISNFLPDTEGMDSISGYRADDSYFSYARAFLANTISIEQLSRAMEYGRLGRQIFIKSSIAFEQLYFVRADAVPGREYYPKRMSRDKSARMAHYKMLEEESEQGIYINDIMKRKMKPDELRI